MTKRLSALFAVALLAAAGCSGSQGPAGPAGPSGPAGEGDVGPGGMGSITVHLTFTSGGATYAAPGVYCFTNPDFTGNSTDTVADATSDVSGNAVFSVPGGTYKIQCRGGADYDSNIPMTDNISVAAGGSQTVNVTVTRTNPLFFTAAPSVSKASPLGTGTVTVGATSISATFTVTQDTGKSAVDVLNLDATAHTFALPDVDGILAGLSATWDLDTEERTNGRGKYKAFELPVNPAFVGLGDGVARSLAVALVFTVTADDGNGHTTSVNVTGAIGGFQDIQGGAAPSSSAGTFAVTNAVGPVGVMAIASDKVAASYNWALTAADKTGAAIAAADLPALGGATTRNPYFTPVVEGVYTLTNSVPTTPTVLKFTAAKYLGLLNNDGTSGACAQCHDGPDSYVVKVLGYKSTPDYFFHAMGVHGNHNYFTDEASRASGADGAETILQWGLQGVDYSTTCYKCHTTGSFYTNSNGPDATVDNNGFQARMNAINAANVLADPTSPPINSAWLGDGLDHWTSLDGGLKATAGIQCESCHGPASVHAATGGHDLTTGEVKGLVIPWGVSACAVCHDAPGHHDKVELWSQSGHANMALAIAEGAASSSCARCHGAQGFAAYVGQQAGLGADCSSYQDSTGKAITLNANGTLPNGNLPYADNLYVHVGTADTNGKYVCKQMAASDLANIGITAATVQPQTCQACHEAHTTELRIDGDTGALAAGFSVKGAGAGALCMTCHNGRNGPRGDSVTAPTAGISASHTPTQTEIFFDQNFYWVNGIISPHAAVGDTCVGCHVQLHPDSVVTANNNHTFEADETICKNCHGASTDPSALFGQYDAGMAKLLAAMTTAIGASPTVVGVTMTIDDQGVLTTVTNSVSVPGATVTSYDRSGVHLQLASAVTDPVTGKSVTTMVVSLAPSTSAPTKPAAGKPPVVKSYYQLQVGGTTVSPAGRLAKAGWNVSMLNNRSSAVHNPLLVPQVFTISSQKVVDPSAGAL